MIFRLTEELFRLTEALFRLTEALFRLTEALFRLTGVTFRHFAISCFKHAQTNAHDLEEKKIQKSISACHNVFVAVLGWINI